MGGGGCCVGCCGAGVDADLFPILDPPSYLVYFHIWSGLEDGRREAPPQQGARRYCAFPAPPAAAPELRAACTDVSGHIFMHITVYRYVSVHAQIPYLYMHAATREQR